MHASKRSLIVPILLIGLGVGWLLTSLGVAPGINWIWTLGLAVLGLLTFVVNGLDKVTVVIGPFLIVASVLSVMRQTDRLVIDHEMPILVVVAGLLLLLARLPVVPVPAWFYEQKSAG